MLNSAPGAVDPFNSATHNKILYCVYGYKCFPQILTCKIINSDDYGPIIWGYSVYKRKPGFRTLGQQLEKWIEQNAYQMCIFFDEQPDMLECVRKLTTPARNVT